MSSDRNEIMHNKFLQAFLKLYSIILNIRFGTEFQIALVNCQNFTKTSTVEIKMEYCALKEI